MNYLSRIILTLGLFLYTTCLFAAPSAPDASITFETTSISAGIGGSSGEGVLNYKGYDIPFSISGYSIGEAGIAKKKGYGFVYNLSNLSDFNGKYSAQTGTVTLLSGVGYQRLNSDKKVFVELRSSETGVNIGFAGGGITMTLDKEALNQALAALNAPMKKQAYQSVYFDMNSFTVRDQDKPKLQDLVAALRKGPASEVLITGYTDTTGSLDTNVQLSKKRAMSVYKELSNLAKASGMQKVPPQRMVVFGAGEAGGKPNNDNKALRRVDVAVVYSVPQKKVYR